MRFNSTQGPVVDDGVPEKVGHLTGVHAQRLQLMEGLPPRGPAWGPEENARLARFDAPVEPIDLPAVDRREAFAPGPNGDVRVIVTTPRRLAEPDAAGRRGVIVWMHGGAFLGGSPEMPEGDHTAARLAHATGLPVVNVDYRLATEGRHHPVLHDDVWAAYTWARSGGHGTPTDPGLVFVGGGSAGAALAATIGHHGRDAEAAAAGVFLAYPLVHYPRPPASAELAAALAVLPDAFQDNPDGDDWLMSNMLGPDMLDIERPEYALAGMTEDFNGYPRTFIENCELDGLRASGERFAQQLADAGVDVEVHTCPGELHAPLNVPGLDSGVRMCAHLAAFINDVINHHA
ncbi:MAG: alpha/beta hydrolase [Actinomyces ruminicola]|uniref:Acetyl esterase/lipase n=1 Tax=Actinomyces ruminicola TaxID=332524 RepID=A0A1H0B7N2_9ACTO|nr:alpha/beta hydrolase fold domain-containing protein [Actinomyces ruminicola]MBE6481499.1 alpha/beta hydrolase [Actinomyces ruminicola]SDN41657.1 Acetyl esterase/lipase [Actinomyces ruminicola]